MMLFLILSTGRIRVTGIYFGIRISGSLPEFEFHVCVSETKLSGVFNTLIITL